VVPVAAGTVLRTPSLPAVRNLNALRIEDDHPSLTHEDLAGLADEHLGALPHRCVKLEHPAAAARLDAGFAAAGWRLDRDVVMGLGRHADRIVRRATSARSAPTRSCRCSPPGTSRWGRARSSTSC
jgi:hypothetical protein